MEAAWPKEKMKSHIRTVKPTRYSVQHFSQRGGDGKVQGAILVSCSIHGVLDQVAGGINTAFVELEKTKALHVNREMTRFLQKP